MGSIQYRPQFAFRAADVDRHRFNEAVAAGNYPCAPRVLAGAPRVFNERQVLTLMVYGRLLHFGLSPSTAGDWACKVDLGLRRAPKAERITLEFDETGLIDAGDADDPELEGELAYFVIDVGALRKRLEAEVAKEQAIVGADNEVDE